MLGHLLNFCSSDGHCCCKVQGSWLGWTSNNLFCLCPNLVMVRQVYIGEKCTPKKSCQTGQCAPWRGYVEPPSWAHWTNYDKCEERPDNMNCYIFIPSSKHIKNTCVSVHLHRLRIIKIKSNSLPENNEFWRPIYTLLTMALITMPPHYKMRNLIGYYKMAGIINIWTSILLIIQLI